MNDEIANAYKSILDMMIKYNSQDFMDCEDIVKNLTDTQNFIKSIKRDQLINDILDDREGKI